MTPSTGLKTLLVVGAASKLGTALIRGHQDCYNVVGLWHRTRPDIPDPTEREFDPSTQVFNESRVRLARCDLASPQDVAKTIENLSSLGISIDRVAICSGDVRFLGAVADSIYFPESIIEQFRLNLLGPSLLCSSLFHYDWKTRNTGNLDVSVVIATSISGCRVYPGVGQAFYAASKSAANMMCMHMAAELSPYGIRVHALAPTSFPGILKTEDVAKDVIRLLESPTSGTLQELE
jgi:NAD(P)-dependent dehydrogenase (short-subunit alcohol dehydrogenase family)